MSGCIACDRAETPPKTRAMEYAEALIVEHHALLAAKDARIREYQEELVAKGDLLLQRDAEIAELRLKYDCGKDPCAFIGGFCLKHSVAYYRLLESVNAEMREVRDKARARDAESRAALEVIAEKPGLQASSYQFLARHVLERKEGAVSDPCAFPGCGEEEGHDNHVCFCCDVPYWPEDTCHPPSSQCHPYKSARESKAEASRTMDTAGNGSPVRATDGSEPESFVRAISADKLRADLQSSGGNGGSTKGADGSAQRPTAWIGTAQASHEERPLVRGSSKEGATANSPSQEGPPPSQKPEDASPADNQRADPPAPLRNREATCRACKDFHETGDCPDEFEQMLDLHHDLLRAERERAEKAEAENENLLANLALLDNAGRQRDAERERADQAEEKLARIEEEARLSAGTFTGDLLRALLDGKSVRSKAWMERRGRE